MRNTIVRAFAATAILLLALPCIAVSTVDSVSAAEGDYATNMVGELTLQEWFDTNGFAINVSTDELGLETFGAGYYQIGILAEIAAYAPVNNLSWYPTSSGQIHLIFRGANTTGDTAFFNSPETFGLCIATPDGVLGGEPNPQLFYTETSRNLDGFDHALVFANPHPCGGYIIVWEDLWQGGDKDYQDMILAMLIPVIRAKICICPHTLNLKCKGKWITCFIKLPREYDAKDINVSTILLNNTVPAQLKPTAIIYLPFWNTTLLMVKFNRTAVAEYIQSTVTFPKRSCKGLRVTLTVTGKLDSGQAFEGSTRIRVIHFARCRFHCNKCSPDAANEWHPLRCSPRYMPI